jgi:hypothetical protein
MQAEQTSLEKKHQDLAEAFRDKTKAHAQTVKMYQSLKAQVMASQVANAAGDEAEYTLQTARRDRFIDRVPGARTGSAANYSQMGASRQPGGGRLHHRDNSRSSGSGGQQQTGISLGPPFANHLRARVQAGREFLPAHVAGGVFNLPGRLH